MQLFSFLVICHFKVHKQNIWITDWNLLIFVLFYPHGFDDSFKKNEIIICNVIKGKSQWEKLLLMFFFFFLFLYWNSMLVKLNISISFWFSRHHTIYMLYFFLVKMMAIVFYCTPTLDVFWILGLLTLRLKKVKIVKSMIIKKPSKVIQSIYFLEVFWMSQPPKLLFQYTAIVIFLNFHFFIIFSTHWELPAAVNASSFLPYFLLVIVWPTGSSQKSTVHTTGSGSIQVSLCVRYTSWPLKLRSVLMGHTWHKDASKRNICETFAACWDKEPKIGVVRCHPPLRAKSSCK